MDKILIVDSSASNVHLISKLLGSAGYKTSAADSGHRALSGIKIFMPDLIILDMDLPDISGYDLCKRIKRDSETKYIMVLCMTSLETQDLRSIETGADDFIEKPFDSALLLLKVKALLRVRNLSAQLKQQLKELEEKNSILEFQLRMGRKVQRSLIPDLNMEFHDVRITSQYIPAMDIGGDFYNVVQLSSRCVGVILGDVSGHGISAALLTSMFNAMISNLTKVYFRPDELLFNLNNEFCRIFGNKITEIYTCIFYAIIDTEARQIYYSNAGQTLPIFVDSGSAEELESSGVPIGLMDDSEYEFKTISYSPGDLLLLHTDGLCDAFHKDTPEEFSQRLKQLLTDARTISDPKEIIEMIMGEFYNYNPTDTERYEMDDVSVVLCQL